MKVALAVSARAVTEPASRILNSDHGPVRSSTEGWLMASLVTDIAVLIDGPGHCTLVGATFTGCAGGDDVPKTEPLGAGVAGLTIVVPPRSIFALAPAPV